MLSRNLFQPRTEYLDSFIHFCLASSEPPGAGGAGVSIPPFHTATVRRTTSKNTNSHEQQRRRQRQKAQGSVLYLVHHAKPHAK